MICQVTGCDTACHSRVTDHVRWDGEGRCDVASRNAAPCHRRSDVSCYSAAAPKTIPGGPQPTKARPRRASSSPQQRQGVSREGHWRWSVSLDGVIGDGKQAPETNIAVWWCSGWRDHRDHDVYSRAARAQCGTATGM